jgi:endoglucanase
MRPRFLCLSIIFFGAGSLCWANGIFGGTIFDNHSSPSRSVDARGNSAGRSSIVKKLGSGSDRSSASTTWSQDLALSVNGPIPVIVVDQFGYPTKASKIAVIRDPKVGYDKAFHFTPGATYAIVDQSTGKIAKRGPPTPWNGGATDSVSGDKVWWFDFSNVTTPGTYAIVDIDKGVRSPEFEINDRVYRNVLKHAARMFFYQRAGFKKTEATAGSDWTDAASHMGPGQDPQTRPWPATHGLDNREASQVKDLHGGWFDAGDYSKYTSWTAQNIVTLLHAYSENPTAFGDDTGIAESGNGVPDILDEVKWALDWLARMQNTDGSLLCVQGLDQASPPSTATGPSYYGPATTAASLTGAAAFAYAARIYSARSEPDLRAYGNDLVSRAKRAWDWATANPDVVYYNNDDRKQPGSAGLASGQQEMDDAQRLFAKFEAAVYLYEITDDVSYKDFVESHYASIVANGPTQWDADRQEILLYYTRLPDISSQVKSSILTKFVTNMTRNSDQLPAVTSNEDAYLSPIRKYTWGSNQSKLLQARLYQLLALYDSDAATAAKADSAAIGYLHYIHGVNPLGLVYLTNMKSVGASHSVSSMFHSWFAHGTRWERVSDATPGPPPGYLVGGPNPDYAMDKCCAAALLTAAYRCYFSAAFSLCRNNHTPPLGQPALKSYREFNEGWPANSWEVTEPSTGYQAHYISVLARYAH